VEDGFKVFNADLVMTFVAGVFRVIEGTYILFSHSQKTYPKEMNSFSGGFLSVLFLFLQNDLALIPQFFRDYRFDLAVYPIGSRFELPVLFVSEALRIVDAPQTFALGSSNSRLTVVSLKLGIASHPIARLGLTDRATVRFLCVQEIVRTYASGWELFRVRNKLFIYPLISVRCGPS